MRWSFSPPTIRSFWWETLYTHLSSYSWTGLRFSITSCGLFPQWIPKEIQPLWEMFHLTCQFIIFKWFRKMKWDPGLCVCVWTTWSIIMLKICINMWLFFSNNGQFYRFSYHKRLPYGSLYEDVKYSSILQGGGLLFSAIHQPPTGLVLYHAFLLTRSRWEFKSAVLSNECVRSAFFCAPACRKLGTIRSSRCWAAGEDDSHPAW